jgi:uncharacterized protein YegP (UPF0339 family)
MATVEFYEDDQAEWRWRVKAANGEVVVTGEGHSREGDAIRAFLRAEALMYDAKETWLNR